MTATAPQSTSSYFRQLYVDHPDWLKSSSNDKVYDQYRRDHNLSHGSKIPDNIKQLLSTAKTVMRKQKQVLSKSSEPERTGNTPSAKNPNSFEVICSYNVSPSVPDFADVVLMALKNLTKKDVLNLLNSK